MEKAKARGASAKKRPGRGVPAKKSAPRSARTRSLSQPAVAARGKVDQDRLVEVLTDLVEISVEMRDLLMQIRDALVEDEGEEAEPDEVDTVVIAEAESPESSEDKF
jgi:hypothetical protein